MKFSFADIKVEITYKGERLERDLKDYRADFLCKDFSIAITDDDVKYEDAISQEPRTVGDYKMSSCLRKIGDKIFNFSSFILHSACFDVDGVGVAFAAHSGTGKTTHMNLWQKLLGDRMVIVNGDKPIVRFFDDEPETPYAYGTPWNGKEQLGCNMRTKLKHICFIERSETNYAQKMDKNEAINLIFNQVYKPSEPMAIMKTMELIDRLLSCCNLWKIHCNMEDEAAEIAYNTIFSDKV